MLIYRLVSWIFISAIGWVVFFFMFRTESRSTPTPLSTNSPAKTSRTSTTGGRRTTRRDRSARPLPPDPAPDDEDGR